jgi:quercetin dioxygenase-like cupin family protein
MPDALVVTPATAPPPLNVVGEHITVLASGAQTGAYEIFHQAGPEGCGPPPHTHPWAEAFYVFKGQITFGVGDREVVAQPNTMVHVPAGAEHWFRFGEGGGEMISVTSCEGASRLFADIDREISAESPDLGKLAELGKPYGLAVMALSPDQAEGGQTSKQG